MLTPIVRIFHKHHNPVVAFPRHCLTLLFPYCSVIGYCQLHKRSAHCLHLQRYAFFRNDTLRAIGFRYFLLKYHCHGMEYLWNRISSQYSIENQPSIGRKFVSSRGCKNFSPRTTVFYMTLTSVTPVTFGLFGGHPKNT